jgi:hypothetical protein
MFRITETLFWLVLSGSLAAAVVSQKLLLLLLN